MLNPYLLWYKDKQIFEEYQNQRKEQQRKLNQFIGWNSIGFSGVQWWNFLSLDNTSTQDILFIILTSVSVSLSLFGLYQNRKDSLNAIKYFFLSTVSFHSQLFCSSFANYFIQLCKFSMLIQGWTFGYIFVVQLLVLPNWYQKLFVLTLANVSLGTIIVIQSEEKIQNQFLIQLSLISVLIVALFYIYEKYEKENFQNIHEQKRSLQEWKNLLNYTMASSIFVIVPEQPNKHKLRFWNQTFHEKFGHINNNEFLQCIQKITIKEHKTSISLKKGATQQNQHQNTNNNQSNTEINRNFGSDILNNVNISNKQNSQNQKNNQRHFHHYSSSSSSISSSSQVSTEQSSSNLLKKIDQIYQQLKQNRMNQQGRNSNINTTKSFCPQIEEKYHNCLFKQSVVVNNYLGQDSSDYNENKYINGSRLKKKSDPESINRQRGAETFQLEQNSTIKKTNHSFGKSQENTNNDKTMTMNVNQYYDIKLIGCYWDNQDAVMVIMDDISEKIINERLKETDEYKDQMLATVTHDLKTPLNGIIIMIKTLIETNQHSEEELKVMRMVLQNANLLLSMIQDILDYSQIKRNVLRLAPDKFKIEEVIEEVYELFFIQAQEKGLELRVAKDGVLCNNQYNFNDTIVNDLSNDTPKNLSSSSSKQAASFGRIDKCKNGVKLSTFFNEEQQSQTGYFSDQEGNNIQQSKRKVIESPSNGLNQSQNNENHTTNPLSAKLKSSSFQIRKSLSIKTYDYQIDRQSSENKDSQQHIQTNLNENQSANFVQDFVNKQFQEKFLSQDFSKNESVDENKTQQSFQDYERNDDYEKAKGELSYAGVIDQRRFNGKLQHQGSNLLKFSIDLMSSGKYCTEVYSDKRRIKQILINLVGNALKFTERGSISIEYNMHSEKNLLELVVRDTGVGISESLQPKLFKVYSTFDHNNGSNRHGVGLGLAICKKLAEQLGPEKNIKLTSTKGDGSAFSFFIYLDIGIAIKKYRQQQPSEQDEEDREEQDESEGLEDEEDDEEEQEGEIILNEQNQNLGERVAETCPQIARLQNESDNQSDQVLTQELFSQNQQNISESKADEQSSNLKRKFSSRFKRNLYVNCPKSSYEEPSSYQTSFNSFFNQGRNSDNQVTARIDEGDHLNSPRQNFNRIQCSQRERFCKFLSDSISTNNQSVIKQERYHKQKVEVVDNLSSLQIEESCNYNFNLVDEMKHDQISNINSFNHRLGSFAKNEFGTITTTDENIHQTTQQKLQSLLKLNLQPSVYIHAKDGKNQSPSLNSASFLQNDQAVSQYCQNQASQNQNQPQTLKSNLFSLDQFLSSPKSCSIVPYQNQSKPNPSNIQEQNNQAKTSIIENNNLSQKANSQSIKKSKTKGNGKTQKTSSQLTNNNQKATSKTLIPQTNLIQQQSYIYEFKRPVNILIVDDTTFNLIALKAMLKKVKNITLIADAYNGKEALEKFKQNKFDLVLMDINMPIMDGQESMKHMRSYEKESYSSKNPRKSQKKQQSLHSPLQRHNILIKKENISHVHQGSIICGDNKSENQIFEMCEELADKSPINGQNMLIFSNYEHVKQNNPLYTSIVESEAHYSSNFKNDIIKKKSNNLFDNSSKMDSFCIKKQQNSEIAQISSPLAYGLNSPKSIIAQKIHTQARRTKTEYLDDNIKNVQEPQPASFVVPQIQVSKSTFSHNAQLQISQSKNSLGSSNSKAHWKAIIFAVTAYDQQQDIQKYLQAGANAHISKPIKLENLFSEINKFF